MFTVVGPPGVGPPLPATRAIPAVRAEPASVTVTVVPAEPLLWPAFRMSAANDTPPEKVTVVTPGTTPAENGLPVSTRVAGAPLGPVTDRLEPAPVTVTVAVEPPDWPQ